MSLPRLIWTWKPQAGSPSRPLFDRNKQESRNCEGILCFSKVGFRTREDIREVFKFSFCILIINIFINYKYIDKNSYLSTISSFATTHIHCV